jgi:pimeloyl-ACP methyl ester carboxylesterase
MERTSLFLEINGQKIHYKLSKNPQATDKPTLVFLHEALGSVAQWRDFPEILSEKLGLDVLLFDRLGHGLSDPMKSTRKTDYLHREAWETTPSVLQQLNIEKPALFGHSDGGTIALLYAARFPTFAIITEAAHVIVEEKTVAGIRQALTQRAFLIDKLRNYHGDKAENLFRAWSDTWLNPSFLDWQIVDELSKINCPALVLQGDNDAYGSDKQIELILKNISGRVQIGLIPSCGHTPHREAMDSVLEKILNFYPFVNDSQNRIKC